MTRSLPPRPRWSVLYMTVIAVVVVGTAAHFAIHQQILGDVLDSGASLVVLLARWVRTNAVPLARLDEPDGGTGTPRVHVVRSRRSDAERVIFPYDVR